jgi:molybdopterin converting factor small subunit
MHIRLLFFGATAVATGERSIDLSIDDGSLAAAMEKIVGRFPKLNEHKLLFAVNQEYVPVDATLRDGDELAIFTAVSGG